MQSKKPIKMIPAGKLEFKPLRAESQTVYELPAIDAEGDEFVMAQIVYYLDILDMNEHSCSIEEDLSAFSRSRKTKGFRKVFIDYLEVFEGFHGQGIGTRAMCEFIELMRRQGIEAVCLKAHPIVVHQWSMSSSKTWSEIRKEKEYIQNFYKKNGFDFLTKNKELMFVRI